MSIYKFIVFADDGREQICAIEAESIATAKTKLLRKNVSIIRELGEQQQGRKWWSNNRFDVLSFTGRLAMLLESQIPLEHALTIMEENAENKDNIDIIHNIRQKLHEGKSLSEIVQEFSKTFPPFYSGMVLSGEEAGMLPQIMSDLSRFLAERREFRNFIVTSSIYPLIVLSVTFIVIILLFTVFVPRFATIFADMGKELPQLTAIMLAGGYYMQKSWWILLIIIGFGIFVFRKRQSGGRIQQKYDALLLLIPLLGKIVKEIQLERFMRTMAVMVKSHIHLLTAVDISQSVITNVKIRESFSDVCRNLRDGIPLSTALGHGRYTPKTVSAMLRIAEESGDLGTMLERIADEFAAGTRLKVRRLLALLEPVTILLLSLVVLLVVLAIFLAIMEMNVIK